MAFPYAHEELDIREQRPGLFTGFYALDSTRLGLASRTDIAVRLVKQP